VIDLTDRVIDLTDGALVIPAAPVREALAPAPAPVAITDQVVTVGGIDFHAVDERAVVEHVTSGALAGVGGSVVTPNLDFLNKIERNPSLREFVDGVDVVVADGMPIVWASRMLGRPLPARVAGSDLVVSLCAAAAEGGLRLGFLGGGPGVAQDAATRTRETWPALPPCAAHTPPRAFDRPIEEDPESLVAYLAVREWLQSSGVQLCFVGLGFPKQERLIAALRPDFPHVWFVACGAGVDFAAGNVARAPRWMQRAGLEWMWRLGCEPRRLFRRYVVEGLPCAARLVIATRRERRLTAS